MYLATTSAKLTGSPSRYGWAQVHEFKPQTEEKVKSHGQMFAVVATKRLGGENDGRGVVKGREIISRLHEEYFGKSQTKAFSLLKKAVERVYAEFATTNHLVEIVAVVVVKNVVYSVAVGGGRFVILRDTSFANILESSSLGIVSASGYPKAHDVLILATSEFFSTYSFGEIKAALAGSALSSAIEALAGKSHSGEGKQSLGACFVRFGQPELEKFKLQAEVDVASKKTEKNVYKKRLGLLKQKLLDRAGRRVIVVANAPEDMHRISKNRRLAASVGLLLLILLVVSIAFGIRQRRIKGDRESYATKLNEARDNYNRAVEIFDIDPDQARQLVIEGKNIINQLETDGVDDTELIALKEDFNNSIETLLGEYGANPELFVDLGLLSDNFAGDTLVASEQVVYVYDANGKKIVKIDIETKKSSVFAGPDTIENKGSVAAYLDRVYLLEKDGVYEVGDDRKRIVEEEFDGRDVLYAYAGNLYVLKREGSNIIRYSAIKDGFSDGQRWLVERIEPDFSNIISWSVDGAIWLVNSSGEVFKYSLGNQQNFKTSGLLNDLSGPVAIYTSEELKYIYILEPINKRIVVVDKEGNYRAQYSDDLLGNAKQMVASEEFEKIIFLGDSKLQSIEIKHLE